jgi:hypothetical protein
MIGGSSIFNENNTVREKQSIRAFIIYLYYVLDGGVLINLARLPTIIPTLWSFRQSSSHSNHDRSPSNPADPENLCAQNPFLLGQCAQRSAVAIVLVLVNRDDKVPIDRNFRLSE